MMSVPNIVCESPYLVDFKNAISNPTFSAEQAAKTLTDLFGLEGDFELKSLPSFDDQNYRVTTEAGKH